jgi:hypothetical protein
MTPSWTTTSWWARTPSPSKTRTPPIFTRPPA